MKRRNRPPARTPEEREHQIISEAYDLAEKRILDETATSQLLVHFLRLGTEKARLEREILESQRKLMDAKTENLASSKKFEELYNNAINAMRRYNGDEYYETKD